MMSSREEHKGAGKPSADARISHHGHLPNYSARAWWGRVVTFNHIFAHIDIELREYGSYFSNR